MEEKEDKGFVVRDRRKVSLDDEAPSEPKSADASTAAGEKAGKAGQDAAKPGEGSEKAFRPLPQVTLSAFVFSLSSSALVHLGEIPDPETDRVEVDLAMAKQIIDTLGMLQEKTRGNLDSDEERLLSTVLYDLRLRFVQKSGV
jgi:hypothetical protein